MSNNIGSEMIVLMYPGVCVHICEMSVAVSKGADWYPLLRRVWFDQHFGFYVATSSFSDFAWFVARYAASQVVSVNPAALKESRQLGAFAVEDCVWDVSPRIRFSEHKGCVFYALKTIDRSSYPILVHRLYKGRRLIVTLGSVARDAYRSWMHAGCLDAKMRDSPPLRERIQLNGSKGEYTGTDDLAKLSTNENNESNMFCCLYCEARLREVCDFFNCLGINISATFSHLSVTLKPHVLAVQCLLKLLSTQGLTRVVAQRGVDKLGQALQGLLLDNLLWEKVYVAMWSKFPNLGIAWCEWVNGCCFTLFLLPIPSDNDMILARSQLNGCNGEATDSDDEEIYDPLEVLVTAMLSGKRGYSSGCRVLLGSRSNLSRLSWLPMDVRRLIVKMVDECATMIYDVDYYPTHDSIGFGVIDPSAHYAHSRAILYPSRCGFLSLARCAGELQRFAVPILLAFGKGPQSCVQVIFRFYVTLGPPPVNSRYTGVEDTRGIKLSAFLARAAMYESAHSLPRKFREYIYPHGAPSVPRSRLKTSGGEVVCDLTYGGRIIPFFVLGRKFDRPVWPYFLHDPKKLYGEEANTNTYSVGVKVFKEYHESGVPVPDEQFSKRVSVKMGHPYRHTLYGPTLENRSLPLYPRDVLSMVRNEV